MHQVNLIIIQANRLLSMAALAENLNYFRPLIVNLSKQQALPALVTGS